MIRKFLTSLIIFIGLTTLVNAECNFRIVEFGDSKESIKISKDEPTPIILPDQFGGESIIMPVEALCKDQQELYGSSVIFLFIENKLQRVQLFRANMQDRNLMEYSMNKYGEFNLPEGLPIKDWRGNHFWENNSEAIEYLVTSIPDGVIEMISMHRAKSNNAVDKYYEKVGKWLDKE